MGILGNLLSIFNWPIFRAKPESVNPFAKKMAGGGSRYRGVERAYRFINGRETGPVDYTCRNCRENKPRWKCFQLSKSMRRVLRPVAA